MANTFSVGGASAYSLAFSPDESMIVSATQDGTATIWNPTTGRVSHRFAFYGQGGIPVLFTGDSRGIMCLGSPTQVTRCNLNGTVLQTYDMGARIKNIALSRDRATLIVQTQDDRLRFVDVQSGRYLGYIPPYNLTELTSFSLSNGGQWILVGYADGSVYKLPLERVMLSPDQEPPQLLAVEEQELVTQGTSHQEAGINEAQRQQQSQRANDSANDTATTPAASGAAQAAASTSATSDPQATATSGQLASGQQTGAQTPADQAANSQQASDKDSEQKDEARYNAFNIEAFAGALNGERTHYSFCVGADVSWRTTMLTSPIYEGAGLRLGIGFPSSSFPTTYATLDGSEPLAAPYLLFAEAYLTVGAELRIKQQACLFVELRPAARLSMLTNPKVAASGRFVSFCGQFLAGVNVSFLTVGLGVAYDTIWGFAPEAHFGARIKLAAKQRSAA